MRVLLATDVHVPSPILGTILEAARASMPDAVIVSGDLTDSGNLGDMERLFRKLRRAWEGARLIAVLGNHDLWSRDGDAYSKIERAGRLAERLGVELLDVVGRAELGDYDVVGNVGWYDYSFAPGYGEEDYLNCNPYGCGKEWIRANCMGAFSYCDCPAWFNDCLYVDIDSREFARENKERIRRNMRGRPTILVTHHVPLRELDREDGEDRFFLAFDGQDMSDLAFNGSVKYFAYGHIHERSIPETTVNGVQFINVYNYQLKARDYASKALLHL